ncbi:MAG TPA: hypothetical protein DEP19_03885 [Anaerolineae bacterium]|nr:hypothetical protein [Anaerolineae bacterium]HCK64899.1 hypothetical protein [Anaerolineae bacterium]
MPQIHFNGKTYNSIEEMPPEMRQAYQQIANMLVDKNGNGIPDFLEGDIVKNISNIYTTASTINFNGNTYSDFNELPPDVQAKVSTAFNQMAGMGIVPQETAEEHNRRHHIHNEPYLESKPFVSREYNPVIQEDKNPNLIFFVLAGIGFFLCLGIGFALLLFSI